MKIVEKEGGTYQCHHCDKGKAIVEDKPADSGPADSSGPPTTKENVEKEDAVSTTTSQSKWIDVISPDVRDDVQSHYPRKTLPLYKEVHFIWRGHAEITSLYNSLYISINNV